jgi:hypothetical protein
MCASWPPYGWLGGLATCSAVASCGRIGYVPDGDSAIDGSYEPGLGDGWTGSSSGSGPDASSDADPTVAVGVDVAAPDSTAANDDAQGLDAVADQTSDSAADTSTEAGPDGPDIDCGSACCCAYVRKYPLVPVASTCGGASDPAQISLETDIQGWQLANATNTTIPGQTSLASTEVFSGVRALLVTTSVPSGSSQRSTCAARFLPRS